MEVCGVLRIRDPEPQQVGTEKIRPKDRKCMNQCLKCFWNHRNVSFESLPEQNRSNMQWFSSSKFQEIFNQYKS